MGCELQIRITCLILVMDGISRIFDLKNKL